MHTKGPWYASESFNIHEQRIVADEETGQTIAIVYGRGSYEERIDETRANAHLIAAAPELLEALKKAVSLIEGVASETPMERFYQSQADSLQEVINKAEGKG